MSKTGEHKFDYAINHLSQERSRIATERDVANNKDYDLAKDLERIVEGLDAAIKLLEENRTES